MDRKVRSKYREAILRCRNRIEPKNAIVGDTDLALLREIQMELVSDETDFMGATLPELFALGTVLKWHLRGKFLTAGKLSLGRRVESHLMLAESRTALAMIAQAICDHPDFSQKTCQVTGADKKTFLTLKLVEPDSEEYFSLAFHFKTLAEDTVEKLKTFLSSSGQNAAQAVRPKLGGYETTRGVVHEVGGTSLVGSIH